MKSAILLIILVLSFISFCYSSNSADYTFTVDAYDKAAKNTVPVPNAVITVTYSSNGSKDPNIQAWSGKVVQGRTDSSGVALINLFDLQSSGLFDISYNRFGPYGSPGLLVQEVSCSASGYDTVVVNPSKGLTPRNSFGFVEGNALRGHGLKFHLAKGTSSGSASSTTGTIIGSGSSSSTDIASLIKCWLQISPNPAKIPENYTVSWMVKNGSKSDITVYYITAQGEKTQINQVVPAGSTMAIKSGSGVTYQAGNFFNHDLYIYTSIGTFRAPDVTFVVY